MEQSPRKGSRFWERLIEPHEAVRDPERRSGVRVLAAFMLGLTILDLLISTAYILYFRTFEIEFWFSAGLFFLAYILSRSPRPSLAEFAIVIGMTGLIAFVLITHNASSQNLVWTLAPILLGTILLPMWGAITVTLVNIGSSSIIALSSAELDPGPTFSILTVLVFTSIVVLANKHARERDQEKLAQQARALAGSRARYKALFDDVPIGLFESTPEGKILQANEALLNILGYGDLPTLKAISAADLYPNPADRVQWRSTLQEKGALQNFETQLVRADGERIWVREHARAVHDAQGNVSHYRGSIEDITERRRLQSQVTEQHQALQMIIGAMPNVLLVIDEENLVTALYLPPDFPPLLKEHWTASMEQLVEVLPPDLAGRALSSIETVRRTGARDSFEMAVGSAAEGTSAYWRVKTSAVTESGDILIVVDDVTELKEAEETVRAYADALELRNTELDAFSHTVAHDLRTPLNHIAGYTDMIRRSKKDELSAETSDLLERVEYAAYQMSEMIGSLLLLSQLRDTKEILEPVAVPDVIDAAIKRLQTDIEERGVKVSVEEPIPDALGYGPWLEEAFANLIANAVKYIGKANADPRIAIRARAGEETVRYEVIDNGLGIAPEDQTQLFEMLTRFHRDESSGTGLGLSIVKRIVEKLGGTVGVESEPGEGSTFWFTLPAARREDAARTGSSTVRNAR